MAFDQFYPSDPYYFCLGRVLWRFITGISEVPKDEGIVGAQRSARKEAQQVAKKTHGFFTLSSCSTSCQSVALRLSELSSAV